MAVDATGPLLDASAFARPSQSGKVDGWERQIRTAGGCRGRVSLRIEARRVSRAGRRKWVRQDDPEQGIVASVSPRFRIRHLSTTTVGDSMCSLLRAEDLKGFRRQVQFIFQDRSGR